MNLSRQGEFLLQQSCQHWVFGLHLLESFKRSGDATAVTIVYFFPLARRARRISRTYRDIPLTSRTGGLWGNSSFDAKYVPTKPLWLFGKSLKRC